MVPRSERRVVNLDVTFDVQEQARLGARDNFAVMTSQASRLTHPL